MALQNVQETNHRLQSKIPSPYTDCIPDHNASTKMNILRIVIYINYLLKNLTLNCKYNYHIFSEYSSEYCSFKSHHNINQKTFFTKQLLISYLSEYTERIEKVEEKPYQCNICGYLFSYEGEKPSQCNLCEHPLYKNIEMKSGIGEKKQLRCSVCRISFPYVGERPIQCNVCEYSTCPGNFILKQINAFLVHALSIQYLLLKKSGKNAKYFGSKLLCVEWPSLAMPLSCTECDFVHIPSYDKRIKLETYNMTSNLTQIIHIKQSMISYIYDYTERIEKGEEKPSQCNICGYLFSYEREKHNQFKMCEHILHNSIDMKSGIGEEKQFLCSLCEILFLYASERPIQGNVCECITSSSNSISKQINAILVYALFAQYLLLAKSRKYALPLSCTECDFVYISCCNNRIKLNSYKMTSYLTKIIHTRGE